MWAVAALVIIVALVGVAQAQKGKQVIYVSSAKATYKPSAMGGVSMQVLVGDPDKGPHATFTKFDPGYDAGMHTHTNDVSLVKGAYLYIKMKPVKSASGRLIELPWGMALAKALTTPFRCTRAAS